MEKITKDQIIFIDSYLKNSGVEYVDVRNEMTDHVATALESMDDDFSENFGQYMLQHKRELLQSNRQFSKLATKRAFKILGNTLFQPWFMLMPVAIVWLSFYFAKSIGNREMADNLQLAFFGAYAIALLPSAINVYRRRGKYSVAARLINVPALALYVANSLFAPYHFYDNAWFSFVSSSLMITVALGIGVAHFNISKNYNLKYS